MTFRIGAALVAAALMSGAQAQAQGGPVTITVENVRGRTGTVHATLFDAAGWEAGPAKLRAQAPAGAGPIAVVFPGVAPGRYAVRLYLDRDGDGTLDTGLMGIPTEPYAFSNNAPARFGPPPFAAAAFDVGPAGAAQTVRLN